MVMRPPVTVPIAALHSLLAGVAGRGERDPAWFEDCLERGGVAPGLYRQANARVTVEQFVGVFLTFCESLDDEFIGLLSRPLRRGSFALLARSTIGAPSLEVALRRFAHTFRLLQDDVRLICVDHGAQTALTVEVPDGRPRHNALHELLLRILWRLLLWLKDGRLAPRRFDFGFPPPPYAALYAGIFPAPVHYNQPFSAVWFDTAALATPVRRDERALKLFLRDAPLSLLGPRIAELPVTARVREVLQGKRLACSLAEAAAALHMSASTLQRHLAAESTSFQALKDELRRDLAVVRLNTSSVPLAVLASELGFADSAAFQRAFKAWTGSSPGAYRSRSAPTAG